MAFVAFLSSSCSCGVTGARHSLIHALSQLYLVLSLSLCLSLCIRPTFFFLIKIGRDERTGRCPSSPGPFVLFCDQMAVSHGSFFVSRILGGEEEEVDGGREGGREGGGDVDGGMGCIEGQKKHLYNVMGPEGSILCVKGGSRGHFYMLKKTQLIRNLPLNTPAPAPSSSYTNTPLLFSPCFLTPAPLFQWEDGEKLPALISRGWRRESAVYPALGCC